MGGLLGGLGQLVFNSVSSVVGSVLGAIGTLFKTLGNALFSMLTLGFKSVFATLGVMVTGLGVSFKLAIEAATEFSKAALSIRSGTGLSYGASGSLLNRGMAFGFSPSETANQFKDQNPMIASLRGNNYQSGNYFGNLSKEFNGFLNSGPMGALMGRGVLKARGVTDEQLNVAAMNPDKVAAQESWSSNIAGKLGLNGKSIQAYAEDFSLGMAKVGTVFELLKLKLSAAIGPQLIAGVEKFAGFLAKNADRIGSVLERIGGTISTVLLNGFEIALNYLDSNAGSIQEGIEGAFSWIVTTLPGILLNAGSVITGLLANVAGQVSNGIQYLVTNQADISQFFNDLAFNIQQGIPKVLGVFDNLINGFRAFANLIGKIVNAIQQTIEDFIRGWNAANKLIPALQVKQPQFNRLADDIFNGAAPSNMAGNPALVKGLQNLVGNINGAAQSGLNHIGQNGPGYMKWLDDKQKWLDDQSMRLGKMAEESPENGRKILEEIKNEMKENNKLTKQSIATNKDGYKQVAWTVNVLGASMRADAQDKALQARS